MLIKCAECGKEISSNAAVCPSCGNPVKTEDELVKEGLSFSDITQNYYPDLDTEDIQDCIQYAINVLAVEDINITPATQ